MDVKSNDEEKNSILITDDAFKLQNQQSQHPQPPFQRVQSKHKIKKKKKQNKENKEWSVVDGILVASQKRRRTKFAIFLPLPPLPARRLVFVKM